MNISSYNLLQSIEIRDKMLSGLKKGKSSIKKSNIDLKQELVQNYKAPDYETAIKIRDGGFPDFDIYKLAQKVNAKTNVL